MSLFQKKTKIEPFDLDWGMATVDFLLSEKNKSTHVLNCNLADELAIHFVVATIVNKYHYYSNHLPENNHQEFVIDIRGQTITHQIKTSIENAVSENITSRFKTSNYSIRYFE